MYKRNIIKNQKGVSPILETLVAVGISIALLVIFFVATTNIFTSHDKPNIDIKAKCISITETLINNPGSASGYDYDWQDSPEDIDFAGLATTELIAYGKATIDKTNGEVTIWSYDTIDSGIGIAQTCFLAGTKIILADGSYKNIEDIKTDDLVKSYDEKTGKITNGKVTKTFHHKPNEMGEYYITINDQLRVTPNHMFYSNDEWIYADDLKIWDQLFYSSKSQAIYSLEKIYEQEPTYNLEVENNHNYFVALHPNNVLVHNDISRPVANFTWFDSDGPYSPGKKIFLNGEISVPVYGQINTYDWYWDWTGNPGYEPTSATGCYVEFNPGDNDPHPVTLKVTDDSSSNYITIYVQANQPESYIIEQKPWVLTGKNVYPTVNNKAFTSYGEDYYIKYQEEIPGESGLTYTTRIFEIKKKTKPPYTIIDSDKIKNLTDVIYYDVKDELGLNTTNYQNYNFNITLVTEENVSYYGATYNYTEILESVKKEVLVYYKPIYIPGSSSPPTDSKITKPCYKKGDITVRVFVGGTVPNYPPRTPSNPYPIHDAIDVEWNVNLSWKGGDVNPGDVIKYDVYLGTSSPLPEAKIGLTATYYNPGILIENQDYYWQIVAHDNHGTLKNGPVWHFKTRANTDPNSPSDPNPINESTDAKVNKTIMSWNCSDPDEGIGDKLTYEVLFAKNPASLYMISSDNWENKYWNPKENRSTPILPRLDYNTTYYWKIKATDIYSDSTDGPIWNFRTAGKGLDQYATYGAGDYLSTVGGIGQTIVAGKTEDLSKINLSLKSMFTPIPPPPEDITVEIYQCITHNPNDGMFNLGKTKIPDFTLGYYVWKKADFTSSKKVHLFKNRTYFIKLYTSQKNYLWQYSSSDTSPYQNGSAWFYNGLKWNTTSPPRDFTFATYLWSFIHDQFCSDTLSIGQNIGNGLAQTFKPSIQGDLMRVNLSLENKNDVIQDITVRIYSGTPPEDLSKGTLATTTIKGFPNTAGKFVWKQANFTDKPPYLYRGQTYSIVISSGGGLSEYTWKIRPNSYLDGNAWIYDPPWDSTSNDFIFSTYMDYIDN